MKPVSLAAVICSLVICSSANAASFRACNDILQDSLFQAHQWAELKASGQCGSRGAKRVSDYQEKYSSGSDNGKCDDVLNQSQCTVFSGGWKACAAFRCN